MAVPHKLAIIDSPRETSWFRAYGAAIALVAIAIGAAVVFRRLPHANLPLLFLMVVLIIAARWGLWPSIFASILSFLSLNFFFTAPFYTFTVEEEGDVATLLFFLAMAGLTGNLAARMRVEMANSRAALERVSALLDFSRRMAGAATAEQALETLVNRLSALFHTRAVALLPNEDASPSLRVEAGSCSGDTARREGPGWLREKGSEAWAAMTRGQEFEVRGWSAMRLTTAGGVVGLVAVANTDVSEAQRELAEGLCDQASAAVERTVLVDSLKAAQVVSETERLRSALLSSVSHDLRTPLASIIGSTTSVLEYGDVLEPDDRRELLQTVLEESQRLNRYIQNLLDMTRFGQRSFDLHREWVDLNDLISSATGRLCSELAHVRLVVSVAPEVALVKVHGALIEQALVNLLDNAAGFAPGGSAVEVHAYRQEGAMVLEVLDEGPGIPEEERENVFDMFYRMQQRDRRRSGTGLGLAICRSIVTAHRGSIRVEPGCARAGTLLRIELPIADNPIERVQHEE